MNREFLTTSIFIVLLLQSVSAHGGEEEAGLTNLQVMLISLAISLVFFIASKKLFSLDSNSKESIYLSLVLYTGAVHVLLGIKDRIFLLGGVGVILFALLPLITKFGNANRSLSQAAVGLIVTIMFIGYFVSNHDLHFIVEDYLGLTTKFAELGIIGLIVKNYMNKTGVESTESRS